MSFVSERIAQDVSGTALAAGVGVRERSKTPRERPVAQGVRMNGVTAIVGSVGFMSADLLGTMPEIARIPGHRKMKSLLMPAMYRRYLTVAQLPALPGTAWFFFTILSE